MALTGSAGRVHTAVEESAASRWQASPAPPTPNDTATRTAWTRLGSQEMVGQVHKMQTKNQLGHIVQGRRVVSFVTAAATKVADFTARTSQCARVKRRHGDPHQRATTEGSTLRRHLCHRRPRIHREGGVHLGTRSTRPLNSADYPTHTSNDSAHVHEATLRHKTFHQLARDSYEVTWKGVGGTYRSPVDTIQ